MAVSSLFLLCFLTGTTSKCTELQCRCSETSIIVMNPITADVGGYQFKHNLGLLPSEMKH